MQHGCHLTAQCCQISQTQHFPKGYGCSYGKLKRKKKDITSSENVRNLKQVRGIISLPMCSNSPLRISPFVIKQKGRDENEKEIYPDNGRSNADRGIQEGSRFLMTPRSALILRKERNHFRRLFLPTRASTRPCRIYLNIPKVPVTESNARI